MSVAEIQLENHFFDRLIPVEQTTPSEWAERYRVLSRRQSSRPGPWRNHNASYLTGIMDLILRPGIQEINVMKAAQVGVSEAIRNVIGWLACQRPDPILLQLPDANVGKKIVGRRIIPLFQDTPVLKELFTEKSRDVQLRSIQLINGFSLTLGYSGSPSSLASDPIRIVVNDEVDKFTQWSGREADPISLAYMRTMTYEDRRLIYNISTPTTRDGLIAERFDGSDIKLYYFVPCSHCGVYQRLVFDQLKYEKFSEEDDRLEAARVVHAKAAWYECKHCKQKITDHHKYTMLQRGVWITEQQTVSNIGEVVGDWPAGRSVGMHVSSLYCLWIKFYEVAAEWIKSRHDLMALMNFRNSWLGEPFEQQIAHTATTIFVQKSENAPQAGIVPAWSTYLLATVDVQKDAFFYVVRAWGYAHKSQRVAHGVVQSFEELEELLLNRSYPLERSGFRSVYLLGIDSGGVRTEETYRWALQHSQRVKVLKGESEPRGRPLRISRVSYAPPHKKGSRMQVWLHLLDTNYYKDWLSAKIRQNITRVDQTTGEEISEPVWLLNDDNDPDYNRQMASEHKILVRKGRAAPVQRWVPISHGAANHYWDCETYQLAMADIARVDLLEPETKVRKSWRERRVDRRINPLRSTR